MVLKEQPGAKTRNPREAIIDGPTEGSLMGPTFRLRKKK
jgi:hypothetical protein